LDTIEVCAGFFFAPLGALEDFLLAARVLALLAGPASNPAIILTAIARFLIGKPQCSTEKIRPHFPRQTVFVSQCARAGYNFTSLVQQKKRHYQPE
jgi:hypothetical protein